MSYKPINETDDDERDDEDFLKGIFRERTPKENEMAQKFKEEGEKKEKAYKEWRQGLTSEEKRVEGEWLAMKSFHIERTDK